jgi:inorganic pyrophosphatase
MVSNESVTYMMEGGATKSYWHDLPLRAGTTRDGAPLFNFVCEIPRGTTAKYEISTSKPLNPIVIDRNKKDGSPRHYAFRSLVNYGALPQTWENPEHKDQWTGELGDGDPVDVCEIGTGAGASAGSAAVTTGSIYRVRIIGALAMLDGGETDWKLIAIRDTDPLASSLTCVSKASGAVRTLLDDVRHWFRTYKVPDGKPLNEFAFNGQFLDAATALKVVDATEQQWRELADRRLKRKWAYGNDALKNDKVWVPPMSWQPPA